MYKFSFTRWCSARNSKHIGRSSVGGGGGGMLGSSRSSTARQHAAAGVDDINEGSPQQSSSQSHIKEEEEPLATGAPFNSITFKPFPIRAAIDVNNGQATLAVARVDARQRAIRDLLFQSSLPVHIEFEECFGGPSSSSGGGMDGSSSSLKTKVLTQKSQLDLTTKCKVLIASMQREGPGVTEVAGLLAWPFYELADGGAGIAQQLTQSLKVDFRVVGTLSAAAAGGGNGSDGAVSKKRERLERLKRKARGLPEPSSAPTTSTPQGDGGSGTSNSNNSLSIHVTLSPQEEMNQLAFLAFAAAAKVVDTHRMVALIEEPRTLTSSDGSVTSSFCGGSLQLVGTVEKADMADDEGEELHQQSSPSSSSPSSFITPLQRFRLPVDTLSAHAMLLRDVQRRNEGHLHAFSSPNPVHRREARQLRGGLVKMLEGEVPRWVHRKLLGRDPLAGANGHDTENDVFFAAHSGGRGRGVDDSFKGPGILVGASENGGLFNIAARLCEKPYISLEPLEQSIDYGMCGLTDVLIGHNLPTPQLIVPQGCLAAAIMTACRTHRAEYLPRVSIAQAILIHPAYWSYSRREELTRRMKDDAWYSGGEAARTFYRPSSHAVRKSDPNSANFDFGGMGKMRDRAGSIARY